jgi:hypothetical protein
MYKVLKAYLKPIYNTKNLFLLNCYQLDLTTPGSLPSEARFRKQIRQIPNFLINALGLPQIGQRLYPLTLNLGFLIDLFLRAFLAKSSSLYKLRLNIDD